VDFNGDVGTIARPINHWLRRTRSSTTAVKQDEWLFRTVRQESCTTATTFRLLETQPMFWRPN